MTQIKLINNPLFYCVFTTRRETVRMSAVSSSVQSVVESHHSQSQTSRLRAVPMPRVQHIAGLDRRRRLPDTQRLATSLGGRSQSQKHGHFATTSAPNVTPPPPPFRAV